MGQIFNHSELARLSTALLDGLGKGNNLIEILTAIRDENVNKSSATIYVELEGREGRVHALGWCISRKRVSHWQGL
jgi:hypothetical protein